MHEDAPPERIDGLLIVGGMAHDFDFVRLELLKLLSEYEHVRVTVASNFEDSEALARASFLITYTCNLMPSDTACTALTDFVSNGGRWFALHGTNSHLSWTEHGVDSPAEHQDFFKLLGSQFIAHPPLGGAFRVEKTDTDHPLVSGIEPFETTDELYLSDFLAPVTVLLSTRFTGYAPGFVRDTWPDEVIRPVLYLAGTGEGQVLYLTLGHARGHYDAPHRTPYYPYVERCSWDRSEYYTLLQRGIAWAARLDPALG